MVVPTSSQPSRDAIDFAAAEPGSASHTDTSRCQMRETT